MIQRINVETFRSILHGKNELRIKMLQVVEELSKDVSNEICLTEYDNLEKDAKTRLLCDYKKILLNDLKDNRDWEAYISNPLDIVTFIYDFDDGCVFEDVTSLRELYRGNYEGWVYRLKMFHLDEKKEMERLEMFDEIAIRDRELEEMEQQIASTPLCELIEHDEDVCEIEEDVPNSSLEFEFAINEEMINELDRCEENKADVNETEKPDYAKQMAEIREKLKEEHPDLFKLNPNDVQDNDETPIQGLEEDEAEPDRNKGRRIRKQPL